MIRASKISPSFGPNMLGASMARSEPRVGISKTDQLRAYDSGELKLSLSMAALMEGRGEVHPPKEEGGVSRTQAAKGKDPSFTSGLPEMKLE